MRRRTAARLRLAADIGVIVAPVLLHFMPLGWIEGEPSLCLVDNIFGIECWGCGITRATVSVLQFRLADAWAYNRLIVIVFPLLVWVWARTALRMYRELRKRKN